MNNDVISTTNKGFTYIEKAYIPNVSQVLVITEELKNIMEIYFSKQLPQFTLVNDLLFDVPQTMSTYDEVHINCVYNCWAQIAYQLSHELCHLMIGKPVCQNMRWFEESVADTSSLFFMRKLADIWEKSGILGNPTYAQLIRSYVDQHINSCSVEFNLTDISNSHSDIWNLLRNDPYRRNHNLYITKSLLPIFENQPDLWKNVPKLGDIPDELPAIESLIHWNQMSNNTNESILSIIKLFISTQDTTN